MLVSLHAVSRFVQRYRPDLTEQAARPILTLLAASAELVGPTDGGNMYRAEMADGRRVSMVVRDDPHDGRVVVTVLPPSAEPMPAEEVDEVLEAFDRLNAPPRPSVVKRARVEPPAQEEAHPTPATPPKSLGKANAYWVEASRFEALERETERLRALAESPRLSLKRELERIRQHAERMSLDREVARDGLRIAVRALLEFDTEDAREALRKIASIEPGWVSDNFVTREPDMARVKARLELLRKK